jgi:predicted phage terminase large subunit-like protein
MRSADRRESLEGFSYDLIFLNEAGLILQDRELWTITIAPMALDRNADCIFAGTPKGILDKHDFKREALFYELYKKGMEPNQTQWKSFQYSTYDNPLMTRDQVEEMCAEIPPIIQKQEIFGEFINVSTEPLFYEAWFPILDSLPEAGIVYKVLSLDTAFKTREESDYSCAIVVYQTASHYIVVDCINEKYEFPELLEATQALYDKYRTDVVLVEDRASGQSLIQSLKNNTTIPVHAISPDKDKYTRAAATTPTCAAGKIKLLKGPWNKMFLLQMCNFPCGNDDIVDSFSQLVNHLRDWRGNSKPFQTFKLVDKVIGGPSMVAGHSRIPLQDKLAGFNSPLHLRDQMVKGYR